MPAITTDNPILIIGAGIVGLTLAQSLQKDSIPYQIFERDTHVTSRAHGWGITIHWALDALKACLPARLVSQLSTAQVDPEQGRHDTGRFLFLDLKTLKPRYVIPPAPRLRLRRGAFREVLMEGVDVRWGKAAEVLRETADGGAVEVVFRDGSTARGCLVVGADGAGSRTRSLLCGDGGLLNELPVRHIGVTVRLSGAEIAPLRAIDPLLFQGCHPETGTFMWFSVLSTPEVNGSSGAEEFYEGQINLSWKVRSGDDEVPVSNEERLKRMKALALSFEERLKTVIDNIPDGTEVMEIKLQDWPCLPWQNHNGKVTLIGDAAHAMTMYRGEAANHGFTDALHLHGALLSVFRGEKTQSEALNEFEAKMRARTADAVLLSRQACLDAHDLNGLRDDSPLVSRRAIIRTKATTIQP